MAINVDDSNLFTQIRGNITTNVDRAGNQYEIITLSSWHMTTSLLKFTRLCLCENPPLQYLCIRDLRQSIRVHIPICWVRKRQEREHKRCMVKRFVVHTRLASTVFSCYRFYDSRKCNAVNPTALIYLLEDIVLIYFNERKPRNRNRPRNVD